eukprot:Gb_09054 [translate_table: standard]
MANNASSSSAATLNAAASAISSADPRYPAREQFLRRKKNGRFVMCKPNLNDHSEHGINGILLCCGDKFKVIYRSRGRGRRFVGEGPRKILVLNVLSVPLLSARVALSYSGALYLEE